MKRWQFSLVTCAAGACLALGVGAGTAAADTGASGDASSSSQSAERTPRIERTAASDGTRRTPLFRQRAAARHTEKSEESSSADNAEKSARDAKRDAKPLPRWKTRQTEVSDTDDDAAAPARATATTRDRSPGPVATAMLSGLSLLSGAARTAAPQPPVTVPTVDVDRYLGTWYEVGSVKQFFSIGLVNTKAVYSLNPDGSIKVQNSGNYFFNNGPQSTIEGAAVPVDPSNNKLNVSFFGKPRANPPGNYWIVDLDPDYQWAIVSDPTGISGFLLTRDQTVSDAFYQELLDRASVYGVRGRITPTRQPSAGTTTV